MPSDASRGAIADLGHSLEKLWEKILRKGYNYTDKVKT